MRLKMPATNTASCHFALKASPAEAADNCKSGRLLAHSLQPRGNFGTLALKRAELYHFPTRQSCHLTPTSGKTCMRRGSCVRITAQILPPKKSIHCNTRSLPSATCLVLCPMRDSCGTGTIAKLLKSCRLATGGKLSDRKVMSSEATVHRRTKPATYCPGHRSRPSGAASGF